MLLKRLLRKVLESIRLEYFFSFAQMTITTKYEIEHWRAGSFYIGGSQFYSLTIPAKQDYNRYLIGGLNFLWPLVLRAACAGLAESPNNGTT